jgi:hypothetical protein
MDVVAILTKVVQVQRGELEAVQAENAGLKATLDMLTSRLAQVEGKLSAHK